MFSIFIPIFELDKLKTLHANTNIAIIIPAAGVSERMGSPKQLLPWGKTNLLGHAITEALRSEVKEVIVILGAHETIIKKEIVHYPVTILTNENWKNGMGSSIARGARHLLEEDTDIDGILVMLADQPLINHQYLIALIRKFQHKTRPIAATSYGKKIGVPAIFGTDYFEALADLNDDYGAKYLMEQHEKDVITLSPGKILVDIDTKADYKRVYGGRL